MLVVVDGIDRLAVDFRADVAAAEAEVIGKARGIDIGDQHTALALHSDARGALRREAVHTQAELGRRGFTILIAVQAASLCREDMRAVFDDGSGFLLRAVAYIAELDLAADWRLRDRVHQVVAIFHRSAVHAGDDVAPLESSLFRRAAGCDVHDDHAVRRAQFLQRDGIGAQVFLEADADGAARYAPLRNDLVVHTDRGRGRQCEADALVTTAAGDDGGVDADHFSGQIDQRAAGVAGVNRRVGLQESLELVSGAADARAIFRADGSRGDRSLQSEGTADGQHPIADLHAVGVAELGRRQVLVGFNLDDRQVGIFINADNFRGLLRLVVAVQLHLDLGGMLDPW